MMTSTQIRQSFLDFFKSKQHTRDAEAQRNRDVRVTDLRGAAKIGVRWFVV